MKSRFGTLASVQPVRQVAVQRRAFHARGVRQRSLCKHDLSRLAIVGRWPLAPEVATMQSKLRS